MTVFACKDSYTVRVENNGEYIVGIQKFNSHLLLRSKNILYLDRDGVLNIDTGYPTIDSLKFDLTSLTKLREFISYNCIDSVCVVSNQSGIARGLFSIQDAIDVMIKVANFCATHGIYVSGFFLSCTHPDYGSPLHYKKDSFYRKPNPGMLELSKSFFPGLDVKTSYLVGDKVSDCQAGLGFGLNSSNVFIFCNNSFRKLAQNEPR